ncbi:MAG: hypothetical protein AVDCRST_MAG30-2408 [uncultured Solirubrobacteraceae bacterium]|uniref:Uncharacterized protein n=1 Tax=uncultured Solirubrobacteraceae bacterium TaxID=1162706 RepID=A0A6J4SZB9_9ACTN|nr:MAG: hypothetical protein AVDCRST_MAG30-2408 [uncultured Solirubrobacteraceae bacterium]
MDRPDHLVERRGLLGIGAARSGRVAVLDDVDGRPRPDPGQRRQALAQEAHRVDHRAAERALRGGGREEGPRVGVDPDPVDGVGERLAALAPELRPERALRLRVEAVEPVEAELDVVEPRLRQLLARRDHPPDERVAGAGERAVGRVGRGGVVDLVHHLDRGEPAPRPERADHLADEGDEGGDVGLPPARDGPVGEDVLDLVAAGAPAVDELDRLAHPRRLVLRAGERQVEVDPERPPRIAAQLLDRRRLGDGVLRVGRRGRPGDLAGEPARVDPEAQRRPGRLRVGEVPGRRAVAGGALRAGRRSAGERAGEDGEDGGGESGGAHRGEYCAAMHLTPVPPQGYFRKLNDCVTEDVSPAASLIATFSVSGAFLSRRSLAFCLRLTFTRTLALPALSSVLRPVPIVLPLWTSRPVTAQGAGQVSSKRRPDRSSARKLLRLSSLRPTDAGVVVPGVVPPGVVPPGGVPPGAVPPGVVPPAGRSTVSQLGATVSAASAVTLSWPTPHSIESASPSRALIVSLPNGTLQE